MTTQVAFLFPGQGSQIVGMGADIFTASTAARHVFKAVDQALGFSLSELCFHGPENSLRETINAQPAIVTVSLALLAAFQEALSSPARVSSWSSPLVPSYTAGHSVGEYAALVAAGALDLESAARLVRTRGQLMHQEGSVCPGGMAAIIGMDGETLEAICQEATAQTVGNLSPDARVHQGEGQVAVANFNAPGAKRVIPLAVSGAFHSPVMQPAASSLAEAIDATNIHDAAIPIIGNIDAIPLTEARAIRAELAQQIASPVQWIRIIEYLAHVEVTIFLEIGPGQALTGMVKRIAKGATTINIGGMAEIEKAVSTMREIGLIPEV